MSGTGRSNEPPRFAKALEDCRQLGCGNPLKDGVCALITQDDIAAICDCSITTVAKWLNGGGFPENQRLEKLVETLRPKLPEAEETGNIPSLGKQQWEAWRGLKQEAEDVRRWRARRQAPQRKRPSETLCDPEPFDLDTRCFILSPGPTKLPLALQEFEPVVNRDDEVATLKALCKPNHLIPVLGPRFSGKSTIIRKLIDGMVCDKELRINDKPISLLYIDLGAKRPMRAFYNSLRSSRDLPIAGMNRTTAADEDDEDSNAAETRALDIILYFFPGILHTRSLVAILDNYSDILVDQGAIQELRSILNTEPFRHVVTILETDRAALPSSDRITVPGVEAAPFSPDEAVELLIGRDQERELAVEAIRYFHDEPEVLYPGVLVNGAARYPGILTRKKGPPSAEKLAEAFLDEALRVVEDVLADLGFQAAVSDDSTGLHTLRAMAVLAALPISSGLLDAAGLVHPPLVELRQLDWLEGRQQFQLKGLARQGLRARAKVILEEGGSERAALITSICRLVDAVKDSEPTDDSLEEAIEEARLWLKRRVPGELDLRTLLESDLVLATPDDELSALTPDEEADLLPRLDRDAERGDLDAALASLVLTSQNRGQLRAAENNIDREKFVVRARRAAQLAATAPRLTARQLKSLDIALYAGSRRYRCFREVLERRLAIHGNLSQMAHTVGTTDLPWANWWISYLLNTADLHVGLGEGDKARPLLEAARRHHDGLRRERFHAAENSWSWWLDSRLDLLQERLTTDPDERVRLIRNATERAERCLKLAPSEPRWVQFYLRAISRLTRELRDDESRKAAVDQAVLALTNIFGPSEDWTVDIRAQVAALMRDEARRAWDIDYRRPRAQEALSLLRRSALGDGRAEISSNARATLVEARLLVFLGELDEAETRCDEVLAAWPSGAAWHLKLKLADRRSKGAEPRGFILDMLDMADGVLPPELRQSIQRFKAWLEETAASDLASARALLWCIKRDWAQQGSIDKHAAGLAARDGQLDFGRLTQEQRDRRLTQVYKNRAARLDSIEKQFGLFIDLVIAKARNEAQYRRSRAICWSRPSDSGYVINHFNNGFRIWPDSHILLFYLADYYRYIWDFPGAIANFRKVAQSATNGDLRRQANVALANTLRIAGTYWHNLELSGRMQTSELDLLTEAKEIVAGLIGHTEVANEVAMLRDQIALELGEHVDWSMIDGLFDILIGKVDGFPNVMIENLDELLNESSSNVPSQLHEVVRQNFADQEILGALGALYLRRAEKELSAEPLRDLEHAYALFNASSLLQRSLHDNEFVVTSFRRGHAILVAARLMHSANPFQDAWTEGKRDQLTLAEAKLQSASSRTTSDFRALMLRYLSEVQDLKRNLVR